MANSTLANLTASGALTGPELFYSDNGAQDVKVTANQLKAFIVGAGAVSVASGKTLTAANTLTLAGTDGSTLNVGAGGTLGTAAFVNTGASGGTVPLLNAANTFGATQTLSPAANTQALVASSYSLTGTNAQALLDLSGTWNTSGNPNAIQLNITDTASGAGTKLVDLQIGGVSKYSFFNSARASTGLQIAGANSGGWAIINGADSSVVNNFEYLSAFVSSNTFVIDSNKAGTGTVRTLSLRQAGNSIIDLKTGVNGPTVAATSAIPQRRQRHQQPRLQQHGWRHDLDGADDGGVMVAPMLLFADYEPVSVKDSRFGAVGDFATDDTAALQAALDFCLGPSDAPHGTANVRQNKALYIPPGHYKISAPLTVKYLHGGRIIGAGRFVTQIEQATPGASVFVTNGCGYARFEAMRLTAAAGGKSFDLDWDGSAGGPALQSNTFCRHALRRRLDRHRDRAFRLHGLGKPVSQLLLALVLDRGLADVERERTPADDHRRKLPELRHRHLHRHRLGATHQRCRLSALNAVGRLHRRIASQRHGDLGLSQREPKLY